MKIPNYDKKHKESKRKLNDFLDEDFRMLITGQTRCGKRNTLRQILREPLVYYDKILTYTPSYSKSTSRKNGWFSTDYNKGYVDGNYVTKNCATFSGDVDITNNKLLI